MKRTLATLILSTLALAACNAGDDTNGTIAPQPPATPTETDSPHALTDTVEVKNSLGETLTTISEIELTTQGCDPVDGATHFKLIATVETNVDSMEILWPSDISFTDEGGMKINHTDLSQDTYPCETDQPEEFNDMQAGDKRRASVTLVAPENPQTMTYSPSTLPDARPVTWDMAGEL